MASNNSTENRGRKPRNYYVDYSKGGNRNFGRDRRRGVTGGSNSSRYGQTPDITFGNRGFLITSVDEVKSYLEMRNVLEDYHEQIYGAKKEEIEEKDTSRGDVTVEDELETELKQLRKNRPFKQVKTNCRNTLFINIVEQFNNVDPILIVDKFFNEMAERREIRSSNTFKVLPILDTFRNSVACAKESVSNILNSLLKEEVEPRSYFIEFQSRGNYKLEADDKQKMIEGVADTVSELRPNWTVSRDNAHYMIVLIALKSVCCISFLRNYFERSKYNVIEFCKDFAPLIQDQDAAPLDDKCENDQSNNDQPQDRLSSETT